MRKLFGRLIEQNDNRLLVFAYYIFRVVVRVFSSFFSWGGLGTFFRLEQQEIIKNYGNQDL